MLLRKWEDLPAEMQNDAVRTYYNILESKKLSLFFKRVFDIIFSFLGLVILSPFFLVLAVAIKIDSPGPIFYRQIRVTRYMQTFRIFKFRTMVDGADKKGSQITSDQDSRITRVGKLIRKLRLDEFSQLIDIFLGRMSFVGTRPESKKFVDIYTPEMRATLLMPAGLTSNTSLRFANEAEHLASCSTPEEVDHIYAEQLIPQKMNGNLEELATFSLWNDFKIICKTFLVIFGKDYTEE